MAKQTLKNRPAKGSVHKDAVSVVDVGRKPEEAEEITDEMIFTSMIEHDIYVNMPPISEYTIKVKVISVEKGEPRVVDPDECFFEV